MINGSQPDAQADSELPPSFEETTHYIKVGGIEYEETITTQRYIKASPKPTGGKIEDKASPKITLHLTEESIDNFDQENSLPPKQQGPFVTIPLETPRLPTLSPRHKSYSETKFNQLLQTIERNFSKKNFELNTSIDVNYLTVEYLLKPITILEHSQTSLLWIIAFAAAQGKPSTLKAVWDEFKYPPLPLAAFRLAPQGKKNVHKTVLWLLARATLYIESLPDIKRIISEILDQMPELFSKEELSAEPHHRPSIRALLIKAHCEDLLTRMKIREEFFSALALAPALPTSPSGSEPPALTPESKLSDVYAKNHLKLEKASEAKVDFTRQVQEVYASGYLGAYAYLGDFFFKQNHHLLAQSAYAQVNDQSWYFPQVILNLTEIIAYYNTLAASTPYLATKIRYTKLALECATSIFSPTFAPLVAALNTEINNLTSIYLDLNSLLSTLIYHFDNHQFDIQELINLDTLSWDKLKTLNTSGNFAGVSLLWLLAFAATKHSADFFLEVWEKFIANLTSKDLLVSPLAGPYQGCSLLALLIRMASAGKWQFFQQAWSKFKSELVFENFKPKATDEIALLWLLACSEEFMNFILLEDIWDTMREQIRCHDLHVKPIAKEIKNITFLQLLVLAREKSAMPEIRDLAQQLLTKIIGRFPELQQDESLSFVYIKSMLPPTMQINIKPVHYTATGRQAFSWNLTTAQAPKTYTPAHSSLTLEKPVKSAATSSISRFFEKMKLT